METRSLILEINAPEEWDFLAFVESVANGRPVSFAGCKVYQVTDLFWHFRQQIEDAVIQKGFSNLLRRQLLTEALVPPGEKPDHIRDLLIKFLTATGVDEELIIVDPYFFAPAQDPSYPDLVCQIIRPFMNVLRRINVITWPNKVDSSVKWAISRGIQNLGNDIVINHATSPEYHDRFWISSSRSKGIMTGSSLNGLGRRYAVVERLSEDDVKDIVASLERGGLI